MFLSVKQEPTAGAPPIDYKNSISAINELKKVFVLAEQIHGEKNNEIVTAFLIKETIKIYSKKKNTFYRSQETTCVQARSCCFFLLRKHTTLTFRDISKIFNNTDQANIMRRVNAVKSAFEIKVTHENLITRVNKIENNLMDFIKQYYGDKKE